jgi:hypothetical protein
VYEDVVYRETIDKIPCRSRLYRPSCLNDNQLSSPSKEDVSTSTYNPSKRNQNNRNQNGNTQNDGNQNDGNQSSGMRNSGVEVHESDAVYWTSGSCVIESDGVRVESESVDDLTDSSTPTTTLTPAPTTPILSVKVSGTSNQSNTHSIYINNIDSPNHLEEIIHHTIQPIHDARDSSRNYAEKHHQGCDKIIILDENSCQNILEESSAKNVPQAATLSRGRKQHNQKQNSFMNLSGPKHPYTIITHSVTGGAAAVCGTVTTQRASHTHTVTGDAAVCGTATTHRASHTHTVTGDAAVCGTGTVTTHRASHTHTVTGDAAVCGTGTATTHRAPHTVTDSAAVCVTVNRGWRKQRIVAGAPDKCLTTSNTPTLTIIAATVSAATISTSSTTSATTTTTNTSAATLSSLNYMLSNDSQSTQSNKTSTSESPTIIQVEVLKTSIGSKECSSGAFCKRIEHSPEKKRTKKSPQKNIDKITSDFIIQKVVEIEEDIKIVTTVENDEKEIEMKMPIINKTDAQKGKEKVEPSKSANNEKSVKTKITVLNATELEKIKYQTWETHLLYIMKRGGGGVRKSRSRGGDGDGDGDGSDENVKVGMKNKAYHSNDHDNNDNNKHSDSSNNNNSENENNDDNNNDSDGDGDGDSNVAHTHLTNCASSASTSTSTTTLRILRSQNTTTTLSNKGSGSDKMNYGVKKNHTEIDYRSTKSNDKNSNYDPSQKTRNSNFNYNYSMKVADRRKSSEMLPLSFFNRQKYSKSQFNDDENGVEYDIDRVIGKGAFGYALLATACSSGVKCGGVRGEVGRREEREGKGKGSEGVEVGNVTKKEEKKKEEKGKGKGKGRGERSGKKEGSEMCLPLHPPPPTTSERTQGRHGCVSTCNYPHCNYCII